VPLSLFNSLPAFFGGKRKMAKQLLRHAPPPSVAPVFVDAFLGGGSVALYAKALGYRVIGNDIAERSAIVGRALIVNSRIKINEDDIRSLFVEHPNDRFVMKRFVPDYFVPRHAWIIDNVLAYAKAARCPEKRDLLKLLAIHFIVRWRPFGDFHQPGVVDKFARSDFEGANSRLFRGCFGRLFQHTCLEKLRMIARDINAGVFSNGMKNEMIQGDVLDLLEKVQGNILYLDPPYFGSNSYERIYRVLDQILAGTMEERPVSRFNQRDALHALENLLEKAARFPTWLLSFGGGKISHEEGRELVARFRNSVLIPVRHRYHYASAGGQRADDKEILVIGRAA
jgi:adenine-specific DNA methylase